MFFYESFCNVRNFFLDTQEKSLIIYEQFCAPYNYNKPTQLFNENP